MDALPWRVVYEVPFSEVALGEQRFDTRYRALVMGIVHGSFDTVLEQAEGMVSAGADVVEVGGMEEVERVVSAIAAIHARFDVPICLRTKRASVLQAALEAGAVVGNDDSGFADPDYLAVAAARSASVVATQGGIAHAQAAGIAKERVMVDAGLELLRAPHRSAELAWPLVLSAPDGLDVGELVGAHALGIALGCRILRAHDVKGARRTADVMAAVLEARQVA